LIRRAKTYSFTASSNKKIGVVKFWRSHGLLFDGGGRADLLAIQHNLLNHRTGHVILPPDSDAVTRRADSNIQHVAFH